MAYDATKPNTSQQMSDVIGSANANDVALKLQQDTHEADVTAAHGIAALLTTQTDYNAHKANTTDAHGINAIKAEADANSSEITAARGTAASVGGRLSIALQASGAIKLDSISSKWIDNGDVPTFVDATHFTVPNDRTKVYIAGAILRLTQSAVYAYAAVSSSAYGGGVTTVVLDPAYPVLAAGLSKVEISLLAYDASIANSVTENATAITTLQGQVTALQVERAAGSKNGKPAASEVVLRFIATRAFSIPINCAGSQMKAGTAATAGAVFNLAKNGANFGTATVAAAGTVAAFAAAGATAFAAGDILTITAPGAQDATLADLAFNLAGTLT